MKFDMSGAAAVIAALSFAASLRVPLHLVGLIGAVENMPGGRAVKPGGHRYQRFRTDGGDTQTPMPKGGSFCATLCTTRAASTRKR